MLEFFRRHYAKGNKKNITQMDAMDAFIDEQNAYLETLIPNYTNGTMEDELKTALDYAYDLRKFEIELYWKRATYFWIFIGSIFVAYLGLMNSDSPNISSYHILLVTVMGYVCSFSWYLVNRGSKFWQQNWEMHVDFLEDKVFGNLYKITKNPSKCKWRNPLDSFPSSVTKINQLLSLFITAFWSLLILDALTKIFRDKETLLLIAATIIIIGFFSLIIFKSTKSHLYGAESSRSFCSRKFYKE